MTKRILLLLSLPLLLFPNTTLADPASEFVDSHGTFFNLLQPYKTEIELGYLLELDHEEKDGPGAFDLNHLFANVELPRPLDKNTFVSFGINYENKLYDFTRIVSLTETDSETLYKIALSARLGQFLTENTLIDGYVQVGHYSDFEEGLEKDAFGVYGGGEIVYRINPFTQILGGVRVSEDYDDTPILPIIGARLKSGDGSIHLSATLPLEIQLTLNPAPTTNFYLRWWVAGDEYRLTAGPADNRFDVNIHDQRVGVGVIQWLNQHFNLSAETGLAVDSELKFKIRGTGQFDGDGTLDNSWYLLARLGYAL